MKRLLFTLLFIAHPLVWAEWEQTNHAGKENSVHYHDKSSIKGTNGMVRMQTLIDYSGEVTLKSGVKFSSMVRIDGYDCKYEKTAPIKVTYYSEAMGTGNIVYASIVKNSDLEWESFSPSSLDEKHWKIACGKG